MFVLPMCLHNKQVFVCCYSVYFFPCLMYTITCSKLVYVVFLQQTNISFSNRVPSLKHTLSYDRSGWVDYFSCIFHTPWSQLYFDNC